MALPLQTTLLLLDLPPKSFVGIDLATFTSTDRFQGIKLIPPGYHFLYLSPASSSGAAESSLRTGFWFHASGTPGEILIKKWDPREEALLDESQIKPEEVMRIKANLGSIWKENLTVYRQRAKSGSSEGVSGDTTTPDSEEWRGLGSFITGQLLTRVLGNYWKVTSTSCASADADNDILAGLGKALDERIQQGREGENKVIEVTEDDERELGFTSIDLKRTWPEGAIGRQRTEMAKDRSWYMGTVIQSIGGGDEGSKELLGELQLAFLLTITLSNYSSVEQWKRILSLALTCRNTIFENEKWFVQLLEVIMDELEYADELFFMEFAGENGVGDNFLVKVLKGLGRGLRDMFEDDEKGEGKLSGVMEQYKELEKLVRNKFDWVLDPRDVVRRGTVQTEEGDIVELELDDAEEEDETGEYAPVIVEDYIEDKPSHVQMKE
ncbi:hypothetical protein RUND412_010132 [Rhizina undulata]